jgi:16S rRNA (cytosine1402-N4)-methyltransferase
MDKQEAGKAVTAHVPVLLHDVIEVLDLRPDDVVFDGTAGGGGHAQAILTALGPQGHYIGVDADKDALKRVRTVLGEDERVHLVLGNYRNIDEHVVTAGAGTPTKVLLDLGLSSDQLGLSGRGFSFQYDEPLRMTYTHTSLETGLTAWHVVNEWSEEHLADIIFGFGGERKARKIARAIVTAREDAPINTSGMLARTIEEAIGKHGRVHPATKTFQALRMAVNDELAALEEALRKSRDLLGPTGRIAVISFHSLEDRTVKRAFREWEDAEYGIRITKRPIVPAREEVAKNARARSAKLRCFEKKTS